MELDELAVKINILHQCIGDIKYSPEVDVAYINVTAALQELSFRLEDVGLKYVIRELPFNDNLQLCINRINVLLETDIPIIIKGHLKIAGEYLFKELNK